MVIDYFGYLFIFNKYFIYYLYKINYFIHNYIIFFIINIII